MLSANQQTAQGVSLAQVLATTLPAASDAVVTGCTTQARHARPGDAFIAVAGDAVSQAEAAAEAIARGAAAVVADTLLPCCAPQFTVADPLAAFGAICHELVGRPSHTLPVTAVAGVAGKSTTLRLLHSICQQAGQDVASADDGRLDDGLHVRPLTTKQLTPAPVASWLARSGANGCQHALIESRAGGIELAGSRIQTLCLVGPSINSASTNNAEAAINCLAGDGVIVAPHGSSTAIGESHRVFTYGQDPGADLCGAVLERTNGGQTLLLRCGDETVAVEAPVVGDAFAMNCLAAAATAAAGGVSMVDIARGLESAGRRIDMMRAVVCGQPYSVYLDAAQSPAAVAAALRATSGVTAGRVLAVVDLPGNPALASRIVRAAGEDTVLVAPEAIGRSQQVSGVRWVEDRFSAVALALALAEPGDAVLVLGSAKIEIDAGDPPPNEDVVRGLIRLRMKNEPAAGMVA